MAISEYPRAALEGVKHDARSALRLASKLGYNTAGAVVMKDRQLTGAGLRAAFSSLLARVQRNDRVFIYYSGHGYSQAHQSTCVQGLVAQDETLIPTAELSAQLDSIKALVSDALVIFDACFSGGNRDMSVTRAFNAGDAADDSSLHAKVWTPRGGERCEMPINELSKAWELPDAQAATRSIVFPKSNFTFIAAATEREVALDDRSLGGLATIGLMQCVDEGVPSTSGLVTAQDLANCAQQHVSQNVKRINSDLKGRAFLPHHLTVYGNGEKILAVSAKAAAASTASAMPVAAGGSRADKVIAAFQKFAANSNGNWGLRVEPSSDRAPVGQSVRLRYQTNQPGYVQLLYVGSDRQEISRIWPAEGQLRRINANEGELPVSLALSAPAGENTVLMVLSREPLDLDPILRGGSAPASPIVLQQLNCELMRQRNIVAKEDGPAPSGCASGASVASSGAVAQRSTADGYTARMITLTGTP